MARLLLLDDEPDALEWMLAVLADSGHQVRGYRSGRFALADLDEWHPDLIISDLLMPELDGFAFARLVYAHGGPPVMFISIAMKQADAVLAGAVGYVTKPASALEVRNAVHDALGHLDRRATILVVDDDATVREVFRMTLERTFDVVEASDGAEALALLRRTHVDLLITDVHMPVMSGIELVHTIRADRAFDRLPIIVETSDRSALKSTMWRGLRVAHQIDKGEFVDWLRQHIDASLRRT